MTESEALEALLLHSGAHSDTDNPRWEHGFLGSLRPYQGRLIEANFHEVMEALRVLAGRLRSDPIDRTVLAQALCIVNYGRMWGVDEGGMLRRNGLISDEDVATLGEWLTCIFDAVCMLVSSEADDDVVFESYQLYCEDRKGDPEGA